MEDLPAQNRGAIETSLTMVEEAEVYVGIFAYRYGYVANGYEKSVTHLELDKAIELGIPCLIFLIDEEARVRRQDVETGEGEEKLENLKTFLQTSDQFIVNSYTDLQDLYAKSLVSLGEQKNALAARTTQAAALRMNTLDREAIRESETDLLYYMINRSEVCYTITTSVQAQEGPPYKPSLFIVHGDSEQCLDKLIHRLHKEELQHAINQGEEEAIPEIHFHWPKRFNDPHEFQNRLLFQITKGYKKLVPNVSQTLHALQQQIQRQNFPLFVHATVHASTFKAGNCAAMLTALQNFWKAAGASKKPIILVLAIKHGAEPDKSTQNQGFFRRFMGSKPTTPAISIEDELHDVPALPCGSVGFRVLEKLPNIDETDVDAWSMEHFRFHFSSEEKRVLFRNSQEREQGVPMEEMVTRLRNVLKNRHHRASINQNQQS